MELKDFDLIQVKDKFSIFKACFSFQKSTPSIPDLPQKDAFNLGVL